MQHTISKNGDSAIITFTGSLTFEGQQDFRTMLQTLKDSGNKRWILDLQNLEFIDSAGLGLLLRAQAHAEKAGAKVGLRVPKDGHVAEILAIAQFHQLLDFI